MRTIQSLTSACLGIFMLLACARVASAQTYVWTDERGVVHAAADPSEVPPQYRAKSVRDASSASSRVKVVPEESAPVPAAPRAAPLDPEPPAPATAKSRKQANDDAEPPKLPGKGLPPPDPGFAWHCATDPEGGPPKCEQFEKKSAKRARRAEARAKAREELGIGPTDEFDPDVAKQVDERAQKEYEKTTPVPTTKAPARSEDDDDWGNDVPSDDLDD
jgi:hypothetical protein